MSCAAHTMAGPVRARRTGQQFAVLITSVSAMAFRVAFITLATTISLELLAVLLLILGAKHRPHLPADLPRHLFEAGRRKALRPQEYVGGSGSAQ